MSQSGIYSELKPVWWFARDGGLPDAPKQIQIILSDECNMSCSFCAYRMDESNPYSAGKKYTSNELFTVDTELSKYGHQNPKRMMPTERAMSLVDEVKAAGVLGIQWTGGGEFSIHPSHEQILQKSVDVGLRNAAVSNGLRWSDNLIYEILPRFDWVRVSIDAGDAESFSRIRKTPVGSWDKVWRNITKLAGCIGPDCTLGVGYVVTPENFTGIESAAKLAKRAGAGNIRFSAMFSNEDEKPFIPIYDTVTESIKKVRAELECEYFTVQDNFGSRVAELRLGNPDYKFCSYMWYTSYIGADLNNYVCCVYSYSKRGLMTNLANRKFDEWWASDERISFMQNWDSRGCERCQFDQKNRQMLYVTGTTQSGVVKHVEWT